MGKIQELGEDDSRLRPVVIDALLAREDEIEPRLLRRPREYGRDRQRIPQRHAVAFDVHALVRAEGKGVLDGLLHAVRPETHHGYLALAETLPDPERLLDRELVVGIRDPLHRARIHRAVFELDPGLGVGNLFDEDQNVHRAGQYSTMSPGDGRTRSPGRTHLSHPFLRRLEKGVVLADGALGTLLYDRGITFDRSFDLLNLQEPALVQSIHRDYIRAGAELIETNTFGASRIRLAAHGESTDARRVNRAGAQLARNAREEVGEAVFVAGAIGPLGKPVAPLGTITREEALEVYVEQVEGLVEGGVDLLIIETQTDLEEMKLAIGAEGHRSSPHRRDDLHRGRAHALRRLSRRRGARHPESRRERAGRELQRGPAEAARDRAAPPPPHRASHFRDAQRRASALRERAVPLPRLARLFRRLRGALPGRRREHRRRLLRDHAGAHPPHARRAGAPRRESSRRDRGRSRGRPSAASHGPS